MSPRFQGHFHGSAIDLTGHRIQLSTKGNNAILCRGLKAWILIQSASAFRVELGVGLTMSEQIINLHVELLPEGCYLATSEMIPGLVAQGRTVAEALKIGSSDL